MHRELRNNSAASTEFRPAGAFESAVVNPLRYSPGFQDRLSILKWQETVVAACVVQEPGTQRA